MNGSGLLERVKGWFGGSRIESSTPSRTDARFWSSVHQNASAALRFATSGGTGVAVLPEPAPKAAAAACPTLRLAAVPRSTEEPTKPHDADAPEWQSLPCAAKAGALPVTPAPDRELTGLLRDLPERIARSLGRTPGDADAVDRMADELRDHHETNHTLAEQATSQTELLRRGNQIAERHTHLAESTVDELIALRAAMRNVDESSRRNLQGLAEIEAHHRTVLGEYQDLLTMQHRRLWRAAILAILLATVSLGSVAYAIVLSIRL